jgi:hypothetical protein
MMAETILLDGQEFRQVPGWPAYFVSRTGKVFSSHGAGMLLAAWVGDYGYRRVGLHAGGVQKLKHVHSLVLLAWVGPRPDGMECRHLNGDKLDNRVENLRWGSHTENMQDKETHGTALVGEANGRAKLTAADVHVIKDLIRANVADTEIARLYCVSHTAVWNIKHGRAWAYVEDGAEGTT